MQRLVGGCGGQEPNTGGAPQVIRAAVGTVEPGVSHSLCITLAETLAQVPNILSGSHKNSSSVGSENTARVSSVTLRGRKNSVHTSPYGCSKVPRQPLLALCSGSTDVTSSMACATLRWKAICFCVLSPDRRSPVPQRQLHEFLYSLYLFIVGAPSRTWHTTRILNYQLAPLDTPSSRVTLL